MDRLGTKLMDFLIEFDDCSGRSESCEHLQTYACGPLSQLEGGGVEPLALAVLTWVLALQQFLESV